LEFKASAWEATLQSVISMPLTSCRFQQAALSNHGRFKPHWEVSDCTHQHKFTASLAVYERL